MQVAAQYCTIILLSALMLFHLCVLAKWIPHTMVWGSRIKTNRELYVFEIISLLVTGENSDESEPPIPVKVSHLQMVVG